MFQNIVVMGVLSGKKVAILTENGFEERELINPKQALEAAGAQVDIVSSQQKELKAWDQDHWSSTLRVDVPLEKATAETYDALLIPGGVINTDKIRRNVQCVLFAQAFLEAGKPVAAIGYGPQLLIETELVEGRNMTSSMSLKTDLENAGVLWEDSEVVTDNGLVTSRSAKDLDAFNKKVIEEIQQGLHSPSVYTPTPKH